MKKILNIYKPVGITPLQIINKLKEQFPEYKEQSVTYAGRLDPMAQGVLLLLTGEEIRNKEKILSLDKTYEFKVLFGITTDSFDILGKLQTVKLKDLPDNFEQLIQQYLKKHIGKQLIGYPPFSSKPVNGKPLFWWMRNNRLSEIKLPEKEVEISYFELLSLKQIQVNNLEQEIIRKIKIISGDFRQEEILSDWNQFFLKNRSQILTKAEFRISCSSGTYIRSIADDLGKYLRCGAIALEILRTDIGKYNISSSLKLII